MLIHKIWKTVRGKSEKDAFYGFLMKLLGRNPRKKELYAMAFRHKSASLYVKGQKFNNERLEYLGDAILGAIVADILFTKYPNQKEGFLTKLRSKVVSRKELNHLGAILGFEEYLLFNGTVAKNVLGNCVEAFVGAVYLDFGYERTKKIITKRIIQKHINFEELLRKDENFKSKLVEWVQHEKQTLTFLTEDLNEKSRCPYFRATALITEVPFGVGEGATKKQAEQLAAKHALKQIKSKGFKAIQ